MTEQWYAVWTRSRQEKQAANELAAKGFTIYLPLAERPSRRSDRKATLSVPLFPGYLFVRTAMDVEHYVRIARSAGVANVLGYRKGRASPIPDIEIESIRLMIAGAEEIEPHPYLPVGTLVRVLSGPIAGVVGTVVEYRGRRRIVVRMELLRQAVSCVLEREDVVPLEEIHTLMPRHSAG